MNANDRNDRSDPISGIECKMYRWRIYPADASGPTNYIVIATSEQEARLAVLNSCPLWHQGPIFRQAAEVYDRPAVISI